MRVGAPAGARSAEAAPQLPAREAAAAGRGSCAHGAAFWRAAVA
jgi:hypothetical protein